MNLSCTTLVALHAAAMDENECVFCASRPLTVRNAGCGHATFCELCTIGQVKAIGLKCAYRCGVVTKLVVVTGIIMPTYRAKLEPEGVVFESVDEFLQAKLQSDDAEVAEAAAQAALVRVAGQGEEEDEDEAEGVDFEFHTLREGLGFELLVQRRILIWQDLCLWVLVFCGGLGLGFHVLRGLGLGSWYTYLGVGAHYPLV